MGAAGKGAKGAPALRKSDEFAQKWRNLGDAGPRGEQNRRHGYHHGGNGWLDRIYDAGGASNPSGGIRVWDTRRDQRADRFGRSLDTDFPVYCQRCARSGFVQRRSANGAAGHRAALCDCVWCDDYLLYGNPVYADAAGPSVVVRPALRSLRAFVYAACGAADVRHWEKTPFIARLSDPTSGAHGSSGPVDRAHAVGCLAARVKKEAETPRREGRAGQKGRYGLLRDRRTPRPRSSAHIHGTIREWVFG